MNDPAPSDLTAQHQLRSPIQILVEFRLSNRWKWYHWYTGTEHAKTNGHMSATVGGVTVGFQFDSQIDCNTCRPYKLAREIEQIATAFHGSEMWLTLCPQGQVKRLIRKIRDGGIKYVSVPILESRYALFTTSSLDAMDAELRLSRSEMINAGLMENVVIRPHRWFGTLSSSRRGFLPPAREAKAFEIYHKGTKRRCWHLHDTKQEAKACPRPIELDGSRAGWYVRPTSGRYRLGRFRKGFDATIGAEKVGIRVAIDPSNSSMEVILERMGWDDPRFIELRRIGGWTAPFEGFEPPPLEIIFGITPAGKLSAITKRRSV